MQKFPDHLPPSEKVAPVELAPDTAFPGVPREMADFELKPAPEASSIASHAASEPRPSPQARLDAARLTEANLLAERPSLSTTQKLAQATLAEAERAHQQHDPHKQTPEMLSAEYRATSAATRAARAQPAAPLAYVDAERKYSQGGNGNDFARRQNSTGNRRGAFSRQSLGTINRDPSRGSVPKPVETRRPTIPALAKP